MWRQKTGNIIIVWLLQLYRLWSTENDAANCAQEVMTKRVLKHVMYATRLCVQHILPIPALIAEDCSWIYIAFARHYSISWDIWVVFLLVTYIARLYNIQKLKIVFLKKLNTTTISKILIYTTSNTYSELGSVWTPLVNHVTFFHGLFRV